MKTCYYLLLSVLLALISNALHGQDYPYILDGNNPTFAWGRQISPQKIAIGLSDEGIYELRDTTIWLVNRPDGISEELLVCVRHDQENMIYSFIIYDPLSFEMPDLPVDVLGYYNAMENAVMNADNKLVATIYGDGKITAPNGKVYINIPVDETCHVLASFFLLHHYFNEVNKLM